MEQLIENMEELSSVFSARMDDFEKNLVQSGSASFTPTVKTLAAEFNLFQSFVELAY